MCSKITSVKLSGFYPLSKNPTPPGSLRKILSSWMEYQAKLNEKCTPVLHCISIYIVFQALKVRFIKSYKIWLRVLLFLVVLHQLLHQQISFFTTFQSLIQIYLKKDFCHEFLFFSRLTQTLKLLDGQNLLSVTKVFCRCSLSLKCKQPYIM